MIGGEAAKNLPRSNNRETMPYDMQAQPHFLGNPSDVMRLRGQNGLAPEHGYLSKQAHFRQAVQMLLRGHLEFAAASMGLTKTIEQFQ